MKALSKDEVIVETFPRIQPARQLAITAAALKAKTFAPIRWVLEPFIPDGMTLLAAKPKIGKSWLMLDLAVAVARGGFTFGDRKCLEGDVLYCSLEDSERRLKDRMAKVCPGDWPERLNFCTAMDPIEAGGLEQLRAWIASAPEPRLVIIDTFAKVRSAKKRDEGPYEADYRQAGILKALADQTGCAVLVVHHTRKEAADDPFEAVSGTTGLVGVPDTIMVLKREAEGVTLYVRGRDVEEAELAVEFQRDVCRWRVLGDAQEVRRSDERNAILDALREEGGPMTPLQVANVTGKSRSAVRMLLRRMALAGEVVKAKRGEYALP